MLVKLHHKVIDIFSPRKPSTILFISTLLLILLGALDYISGDYSLIVFYLIPVSLAAWFISRKAGIIFCFFVLITRTIADEATSSFAFHSASLHYWNEGIEFVFLLIMTTLFSALRKNLDTEKSLASTDPLTKAMNRRSFFSVAEYEINRAHRYSLPFTLAYIDLDNFKEINDTLGHHIGDEALIAVTEVINNNIRSTDVLARFGGDEFVLMLAETAGDNASTALQKLHKQLQNEMDKKRWNVTFSIGVVSYKTPPPSIDECIKKADDLMYSVKKNGKNRLMISEISEIQSGKE